MKAARELELYIVVVLFATIELVTVLAKARLFVGIFGAVFIIWDVKNYKAVQVLFGMVMTVLIALEFGNSILRHIREHSAIIQAREVILIGMMAVVRKVMIIDLSVASPWLLAALAALAVSLASVYWFMR